MFEFFRNWIRKQKEVRQKIAFEDGFAWVMTQYYCCKIDTVDIRLMMDGIESPFDDGAFEALRMLKAGETI